MLKRVVTPIAEGTTCLHFPPPPPLTFVNTGQQTNIFRSVCPRAAVTLLHPSTHFRCRFAYNEVFLLERDFFSSSPPPRLEFSQRMVYSSTELTISSIRTARCRLSSKVCPPRRSQCTLTDRRRNRLGRRRTRHRSNHHMAAFVSIHRPSGRICERHSGVEAVSIRT
jgi:hypothetical protein